MNGNGMLVVVSAPSGCGKDTVFKENTSVAVTECAENNTAGNGAD